jgi:hypothetical protein
MVTNNGPLTGNKGFHMKLLHMLIANYKPGNGADFKIVCKNSNAMGICTTKNSQRLRY